ncbi:solute carrier organic anion transporter family member 5A1-like [Watersipora subatra]|uniref:solute carrier organic anion transporter family member 5A1-like n=1 Tax=Watersipora subatra TaxID=2589382 RepID=UPI00355B6808
MDASSDELSALSSNDKEEAKKCVNSLRSKQSLGDDRMQYICGVGACQPRCMQTCANIRLFTILICILSCVNGSISASYLPSIITSIERRFEFSSSITGLIVGSYEIGATIAVIFVSYAGNNKNIPVVIGLGSLLVGMGACLFSLPHFIVPAYSIFLPQKRNDTIGDTCLQTSKVTPVLEEACKTDLIKTGSELYIVIFIAAQTVIGVGSTPILTIALSYIDNHVTRKKSPQYIAFVYAASTLGPVLGFGAGAALTEIYVDFASLSEIAPTLTPSDPQWVGAWWVGFLIFGSLIMLSALPFFTFPKSLSTPPKNDDMELESFDDIGVAGNSTQLEFPKALMKLLRNPIYMLLMVTTVLEMIIVTGFLTFMPKYLETQFQLRTSEANLYTGSLAIPGAVLGILSSGVILQRMRLSIKGALGLTVILSILGLACFSLAFFIGCNNTAIAGITSPYRLSRGGLSWESIVELNVESYSANLTRRCNSDCRCTDYVYNPVCGHNSLTYFSACHAGCRFTANSTAESCRCIEETVGYEEKMSQGLTSYATRGPCDNICRTLVPFMVLVFAICFFVAALKTPMTAVIMRCVDEDLRPFSLGIQMVFIRTCALLPAPVVFGSVIDTTCLWWKFECKKRKNCLIHDVEWFRYKLIGIAAGLHFIGMLTYILAWYIAYRQENKCSSTPKANDEKLPKVSSTIQQKAAAEEQGNRL